jgi:poly-gamma-glutamate synthesis protein (capsule biosynthesis protein)
MAALKKAGIPCFGAGRDVDAACRPWRVERKGVKLAVFGVYCSSWIRVGQEGGPGVVARLPDHAATLEREMATARAKGERILVMIHGGNEYDSRVSPGQRHWARWLVARGASVVAGAHPHVVQRSEFHGGARILHSLGNAVYPKALKGADSGKVEVVEVQRIREIR